MGVRYETVALSALSEDPKNARKHDERNLAAIKGSLSRFGQQKPIVVDGNGIVIAGNGTLRAARELGWSEIAIARTSLTGFEASAFALADNRTAELAAWDGEILNSTLKALEADGVDIASIGFDGWDFGAEPKDGLTDPDAVPENAPTRCKPGDLWVLGRHRLLCGDSTNILEQQRLIDAATINMVFTDPPYGLGGYAGRGQDSQRPVAGDELDPRDFYQSIPDAPELYVWGLFQNLHDIPFEPRDVIVWRKNNIGMGRGYRGQYEVCFYKGGFDGSDSDVWDVAKDRDYVHPTQKPVELAERAIRNSKPQTVLDIYSGSGSTLIACQRTGVQCFAMELEPHYCDVILARWEAYTGQKASLEAVKEAVDG